MDRDSVRLECLKLSYLHSVHPNDVVVKAKIFESYVLGDSAEAKSIANPKDKKSSGKVKGTENADILS